MGCKCGGLRRILRSDRPAALGERGMLLMERRNGNGEMLHGPVTGAAYPFDERSRMFVDRRDAVYLLGPDLGLAR